METRSMACEREAKEAEISAHLSEELDAMPGSAPRTTAVAAAKRRRRSTSCADSPQQAKVLFNKQEKPPRQTEPEPPAISNVASRTQARNLMGKAPSPCMASSMLLNSSGAELNVQTLVLTAKNSRGRIAPQPPASFAISTQPANNKGNTVLETLVTPSSTRPSIFGVAPTEQFQAEELPKMQETSHVQIILVPEFTSGIASTQQANNKEDQVPGTLFTPSSTRPSTHSVAPTEQAEEPLKMQEKICEQIVLVPPSTSGFANTEQAEALPKMQKMSPGQNAQTPPTTSIITSTKQDICKNGQDGGQASASALHSTDAGPIRMPFLTGLKPYFWDKSKQIEGTDKRYKEEQASGKGYFNERMDMKGKVRVFCRVRGVRGVLHSEKGQTNALKLPDVNTITLSRKDAEKPHEYVFDQVYSPVCSQYAVFEDIKHLVQSAVDGCKACIFAYGQTGSGKTFTIYGEPNEPGLMPRSVNELFYIINRVRSKYSISVTCNMLELYKNTLMDLLLAPQARNQVNFEAPKLKIKKDENGLVTIAGATTMGVTSAKELMSAVEAGHNRRHLACTAMNRESSRSHLIISIVIESTNSATPVPIKGKLTFVDLAGSECMKKSELVGEDVKEAQAIKKSFLGLDKAFSAVATKQQQLPYCKLTDLLSDSLGGNAKTLLFVNLSPTDSNIDETENSLQYATHVRTIMNEESKNASDREMQRMHTFLEQAMLAQ